jgi:hypothetical protein
MIFNAQVAFKNQQEALTVGASPRTSLGAHNAPQDPLVVHWGSDPDPARGANGAPS